MLFDLDLIAREIGLGTSGDVDSPLYHGHFWGVREQGDYLLVSHHPENPVVFTNTDESGVTVFSNDYEHRALLNLTSTVLERDTYRVVRCGLPPGVVVEAGAIDPRREYVSSTGIEVDSLLNISRDGDVSNIKFHPRYEGAIVYIWKHNGTVHFSTRNKVNALSSRWGSSRLFSELFASLGGPRPSDLFSEYSPDGDSVMHVFVLSHPSLVTASNIDIGAGRIVYLGAFFSVHLNSNRVRGVTRYPGVPPSAFAWTKTVVDPSVCMRVRGYTADQTYTHHFDENLTEEEKRFVDDEIYRVNDDGVDDGEERLFDTMHDENEAWWRSLHAPFPPPSERTLAFPARGNANASAESAFCNGLAGEGAPEVVHPPSLSPVEADKLLREGYVNLSAQSEPSCYVCGFDDEFDPMPVRGDPVVAVIEYVGGRVEFVTYQPPGYTWRSAVVNNNPNVKYRVSELKTMAGDAAKSGYFNLFKVPSCLLSGDGMNPGAFGKLARYLDAGYALNDIPAFIKFEMLRSETSDIPMCVKLHAWACVMYAIASPAHRKREVLDAAAESGDIGAVVAFTLSLFDSYVAWAYPADGGRLDAPDSGFPPFKCSEFYWRRTKSGVDRLHPGAHVLMDLFRSVRPGPESENELVRVIQSIPGERLFSLRSLASKIFA